MNGQTFTPALGRFAPTRFYDTVVALMRERLWRGLLAMHASPRPGDVIVDVGCGTGTQALLLKRIEPSARVIGVDPDPAVLASARAKNNAAQRRPDAGNAVTPPVGTGDAAELPSGQDPLSRQAAKRPRPAKPPSRQDRSSRQAAEQPRAAQTQQKRAGGAPLPPSG